MPADRFARELFRESPDYVLLTPHHPLLAHDVAQGIHTRVRAYAHSGVVGHVVVVRELPHSRTSTWQTPEGKVSVTGADSTKTLLERARLERVPVLVHSPTPALSGLLHQEPGRYAVWFHGSEVHDSRRRWNGLNTRELSLVRARDEAETADRLSAARPLLADPSVAKIFVSDHQRRQAEWDLGIQARNAHVIPSPIDTETYQPRVRRSGETRNILLLPSFESRHHANDVAINAISLLSSRMGFGELRFTVCGSGTRFDDEVRPLRSLPNVTIQNRSFGPAQAASMHYDNGICLHPARLDAQEMTLGNAMASGMVPITHAVAGIPEMVDDSCGLVTRPDDPWVFANALWHLVTHPALLPDMSRNAASRVTRQRGPEATVHRELEIIRGLCA